MLAAVLAGVGGASGDFVMRRYLVALGAGNAIRPAQLPNFFQASSLIGETTNKLRNGEFLTHNKSIIPDFILVVKG